MRGDRGRFEVAADEFLPYLQHIAPGVVLNDDGSLMAMAEMSGLPFELEGHRARNPRPNRLNSLAQLISDENVTMHFNFVHGECEPELTQGRFRTTFAAETYAAQQALSFGPLVKTNTWFLSIIVHPRIFFEGPVRRLKRRVFRNRAVTVNEECERQLEDIMQVVMVALARYGARRLGYREERGWTYTEIGEALYLILTARHKTIPMGNGPLGGLVYTDEAVFGGWFGRYAYRIDTDDRPISGMIFGYKEYPSSTQVGMLNELLGTEYPLVASHSFRFLNRVAAQAKLQLKAIQMENAFDRAISQIEGLIDMQDQVASNLTVMGSHHFSLAVYADNPKQLASRASRAATLMGTCGAVVARERRGAMGAYFAQLPGARSKYRCRPGAISARNLSHFVSCESYPKGDALGYWGPPVIQFKTNGGTVYNWHPHVGEVGHTAIFGMTGSGKTLLLSFLICALQPSLGDTGTLIAFDKDLGMMLTIHANGGAYVSLRRGVPSGSAPLLAYEDTARNIDHLTALFCRLILLDGRGPMTPHEEEMMRRGVARQLKLPRHLRSMLAIKAFLGSDENGAGERFAKWCRGGSQGWLFDNDEDSIPTDGQIIGYDFTELLPTEDRPDDGCAAAMASDIMFRIRRLQDGRRMAVICDECRFYLDAIAGILEDLALTGRKKELMLFLAAQKPGHLLLGADGSDSALGRSMLAQCPTAFLFPEEGEGIRWKEYGSEGIGCTPAEFFYLKDNMIGTAKRQVMIKRKGGSVVVEFDITGMDDEIAILSGRTDTAELMQRIIDELSEDGTPGTYVAEFRHRYRSLPRLARRHQERNREEALLT